MAVICSRRWLYVFAMMLLALFVTEPARAQTPLYSSAQLDQMLAPIALYPDSLLSQVLMACTYPAEVADAARWSRANPTRTGDAAVTAVGRNGWDPSVASLVAFPQALAMMAQRPDWVQSVGDAFLAQPEDVMTSVQRLRAAAYQAGKLQSNEQQTVIVQPSPQVIVIEPARPQFVYVPVYNPTVVYGPWPYSSYPPYYWPTPGYSFGNALLSGIAFGTGIAITHAIWGGFDWRRHDVHIRVDHYNNININRQLNVNSTNVSWSHDARSRRGVPYSTATTREKFDKQVTGSDARKEFRGRDASRDESRVRAQATLRDRTEESARARPRQEANPTTDDRRQAAARSANRDRKVSGGSSGDRARATAQDMERYRAQQSAQQRSRDNAFKAAGRGEQTRQQVDRGVSSRQVMQERHTERKAGGDRGGKAARRER